MLIEAASSLEDRTEIQIFLTNWRNSLKNRWQISKGICKVLPFHTAQIQARQELVRQQPCRKELGEHSQDIINCAAAIKKEKKKETP